MRRLFSLDTLVRSVRQCAHRFPVTVGFIAAQTAFLLLTAWASNDLFSDRTEVAVNYYLAVGTLLTTVLQLWGEEVKNSRTLRITGIVAHTALLADAAYLYHIYDNASMEVWVAHAAVVTALTLCLFILPFFRERDDVASWNFTLQLLSVGFSSGLIGAIMCSGICLLTSAVKNLFGVHLSGDWYATWCILFLMTLPALLFLGRIPAGAEKFDRTPCVSAFLHKSIHYLFLPLLGCYLLVLYGYLAKIIFQWELPDGWVSKLVSVLTFGCIGVILGLYPSLHQGTSKTDNRMARFLPLAILPLLVLMTVGIARRLNDYGVTVNRLYLLTLNIWFYLVCAGLFLSRARRVWWISASFAALFLLTSALPLNIVRFTRSQLLAQIESTIKDSYKGQLPMSEEAYYNWLETLPTEVARQVNSRLRYLDYEMKDKTYQQLVSEKVSWWNAGTHIGEDADTVEVAETARRYYYSSTRNADVHEVTLDGRYDAMLIFTDSEAVLPYTKDGAMLMPVSNGTQPIDTVEVRMGDLRKWDALSNFKPHDLPCRREGCRFVLNRFNAQIRADNDSLDFTYSGYYLIQKP